MSYFAVTDQDGAIEAINYVLSNLGQSGNGTADGNSLVVNTSTGIISQQGSTSVISYLYEYINVRYADSSDGNTNFSTSPTNRLYYGILNNSQANPGSTVLNNPANYVWYEASGGFGTTKFLYYTTYGGRQIQWTVATTTPSVFYAQTVDATAIDLDFVLSTQALPTVVLTVYRRDTSTPATPTGGTYDFNTLTLTPPSGWSASIPAGTDPFYTSQNTFTAPVTGTSTGPDLAWTTPILSGANGTSVYSYTVYQQSASLPATPTTGSYNFGTSTGTPPSGWYNTPTGTGNTIYWSTTAQATANVPSGTWTANASSWSVPVQFTGNTGATGERGIIPMGYVLTTQNPTTSPGNTTANLTAAFSASRSNVSAPIGTGFSPISGDTASFTWSSNTAVNTVYTYNGSAWGLADGQIINGNVFVTGSVNASAMNANDVYALTMRGGAVTPGTYSGVGYWLQASTGNAYIGGNLVIGANANIGNNLTIGNNVTIGGLTLNGALLANVVTSTSLANGAVVVGKLGTSAVTAGTIASNAVTAGTIATGAVTANTIAANAVTAGTIAANAVTATSIAAGAVTTDKMTANTINGNIITVNTLNGNAIVANTINGNTIIANTINGNSIIANTISGNTIIANTIAGSQLIANTITATQISTAYVYAGNIVSVGASIGNVSSPGYWLAYNTGDARFGGNVSIGSNLNVAGLITTGNLIANTVNTTTMLANAVSGYSAISYSNYATVTTSVSFPNIYYITDTYAYIVPTVNNQSTYTWAQLETTFNTSGLTAGEYFEADIILSRWDYPGYTTEVVLGTYAYNIGFSSTNSVTVTTPFVGFQDTLPTAGQGYIYTLAVFVANPVGTFTVSSIVAGPRSMLAQSLKR